MDTPVNPTGDRLVLLKRGSNHPRIVADRVTGLDKQTYDVMFLGTGDGYLHKAFSCDGEMFIVEELQLFQSPQPVQSLQLSSEKGMLYVRPLSQVVQLPVSQCHQYKLCVDCVLARDPPCTWAQHASGCILLATQAGPTENLIQKHGDASSCLRVGVVWKFNGSRLQAEDSKCLLCDGGIVILNVTADVAGLYGCVSVEKSRGKEFLITVACYALYAQEKTEEANVTATASKHNPAGALAFQSSLPPLLNEVANQESLDS